MSEKTFRRAESDEGEVVLATITSAFGCEAGTPRYEHLREDVENRLDDHYVYTVNGAVVGALHVRVEEIQVGASIVTKGDVGEVGILAERHGQGLGTEMMEAVVKTLREDGLHLSRLGGYRRFYERFGWVPFPRGYIDFALSGLTSRGGFTDPVSFLDRPDEDKKIRPYDGTRDKAVCGNLYRAFNRERTGALPERRFGEKSDDPWSIVYEEDGRVIAYLLASEKPPPHTRFTTAVSIQGAAADPDRIEALGEVIRYTLRRAKMVGAESVSARLPLDSALYDLYRDSSAGFIATQWQSSEGGNMLQVLNPRLLMEAVRPTIQTRLEDACRDPGQLAIRVHGETVGVEWGGGTAVIADPKGETIDLSQEGFCRLLLGLTSVDQVVRELSRERDLLGAMFPVQGTATGVWG